ncbi:hypothetical protein [Ancylomarina sp.]|uniref:hypothetical protein n=1 Tax=Ancylomarina sp. TaxID=1970196 RepID=UPI0035617A42
MECEICGESIEKKRPDSRYCSLACINKAKRLRAKERRLIELDDTYPPMDINKPDELRISPNASAELRTIEREHFDKILNLRTDYGDKLRDLKELNLKQEFTIEKLEDKISDIREKHIKEIAEIRTNSTKETVAAITQMPAIQSALGAFASKLIPNRENALSGVSDQFNIQEKQIIDAIRRMQPDVQESLVQMLYVLFSKSHEKQVEIFSSLQAFMMQPEVDDI